MKKYINTAFIYAAAAMAGGGFYREFTKWNGYLGVTMLGKVHTHLFLLGMFLFLIVALFAGRMQLEEDKLFHRFFYIYNGGVILTAVMMLVHGTLQVLHVELSKGAEASISGIAGIGHILTGTGLVMLLLSLRKHAEDLRNDREEQ